MKTALWVNGERFEQAAADALRAILAEVPFAEIEKLETNVPVKGGEVDLIATVALGASRCTLLCELKINPQPGVIRPAIDQLRHLVSAMRRRGTVYGVFIARYVSPRTAQICADAGVGYLDLAGNCRLAFGAVYIRKIGEKNRTAARRDARSLYSPKAARALRVLLTSVRPSWKVQELAREAEISIGQASNVKKLLAEREWIRSDANGFKLTAPEILLKEWAENQIRSGDLSKDFYSLKPLPELEGALARLYAKPPNRYALTSFSAAMRLAPMVRNQRLTAYVNVSSAAMLRGLGLKPVTSGANVTLTLPGDAGVFYGASAINGVVTVSPVQAYLDLRMIAGRGDEAAEAILNQVLRPRW